MKGAFNISLTILLLLIIIIIIDVLQLFRVGESLVNLHCAAPLDACTYMGQDRGETNLLQAYQAYAHGSASVGRFVITY